MKNRSEKLLEIELHPEAVEELEEFPEDGREELKERLGEREVISWQEFQ